MYFFVYDLIKNAKYFYLFYLNRFEIQFLVLKLKNKTKLNYLLSKRINMQVNKIVKKMN